MTILIRKVVFYYGIAKEQLRQIIKENDIQNVEDIYALFKDSFKDILQEMLEAEMVSKMTDHILPDVRTWQSKPLEPIYSFVFMDAIHYKIKEDGRIINRAAYITMGANESSKFWLGMLNN